MFSLAGKTALVTGSRTGIGQAVAVGLAQAGADLILHGHHDDLAETEAAVRAEGRQASRFVLDLADPQGVQPACDRWLAGRQVDILVNNAGVIRRAPAAQADAAQWREVLAVNLDSLFALTQWAGARMLARRCGKVVNLASVLSFQGGVNVAAYAASKHAVVGLTRALANEWAGSGVQVNAIAPGYITTANTEALRADTAREAAIRSRIPAGRWGTPADLAGAAVFLASAASDYVSGHVLAVDGGWLSR
ncbi:MAG TPA: SDR family oxidoreductase [Streptosporangiaceae bacterium]|nr:SDR family oxidoreductase [Streptosporangiaceae bacterium]